MALTRPLISVSAVSFVVLGLVALLPDCASACTCALLPGSEQERAERALAESTAVFAGEVVNISKGKPLSIREPNKVSFRVSEVWKGPERETLEVATPRGGAACGYPFKEGQEYLVYAYGKEDLFKVDLCSQTKLLSKASVDLKALGNGETAGDGGTLTDTSGGFPRLEIVGMMGLALAAVSLVLLMRLVRTS
jgi:hypothetical protein